MADDAAPMGMGAGNTEARRLASLGALGPVTPQFAPAADVAAGGVLLAIPALVSCGLLHHLTKHLALPRGYYSLPSIMLLLACMALARVKSVELLRYSAPGEWGKLLGLDRIPEVRTLRKKIELVAGKNPSAQWSAALCQQWMASDPVSAGVAYVDGHVRVYHGQQTLLPRHYVARQRLCLRATTDYWVNALDGQPFFVVSKAVDPGLLTVLEDDIIPRLLNEIPGQPSAEQLAANPLLHRFTLVFDREGYSPRSWLARKQDRIACLSYHKYPGADWPAQEFSLHMVHLAGGQTVEMELAERGTYAGDTLWVREIRRRSTGGHQTAVLATDYGTEMAVLARQMFARWSQENFFKYMLEHFGLDHLIDHQTEPLPDHTLVVNPAYRELDAQVRRLTGQRGHKRAAFGALGLEGPIEPKKVEHWQQRKGDLQEELAQIEEQLGEIKARRKQTPKRVAIGTLPAEQRFQRLSTASKHFIDTIKMIAYRAESAMAHVLRDKMSRHDDARRLLQAIYRTEADLVPDLHSKTLTVRLHHLANHSADEAIRHLCAELNATAMLFPQTDLRLVYELVS